MTKQIKFTERSQEDAKETAAKLGLSPGRAYRLWDLTGEDFFDRTGWLALFAQNDKVYFYPLWPKSDGGVKTDFPNIYEKCPSLEWFNRAELTTLDNSYEPELIGADGSRLEW